MASSFSWIESNNIDRWYTPLDKCMIMNDTSNAIEIIMSTCEERLKYSTTKYSTTSTTNIPSPYQPDRCRAGNSWPSKGGYCAPADIPYAKRLALFRAVEGYDNPDKQPLKVLFSKLSAEKGALLLIGDSVMQQFYGAIACELEREGIWKDPKLFKNTDELQYVRTDHGVKSNKVPIKFIPIYHFVNGRFDRIVSTML